MGHALQAPYKQAEDLSTISWGTNHPKRLVWLVGSISRKLAMGFFLFDFVFKISISQTTSLCYRLLLYLLFSFSFSSFETKKNVLTISWITDKAFLASCPCGYRHYCYRRVSIKAKAHTSTWSLISKHYFLAQLRLNHFCYMRISI